jgi:hypothetical protein
VVAIIRVVVAYWALTINWTMHLHNRAKGIDLAHDPSRIMASNMDSHIAKPRTPRADGEPVVAETTARHDVPVRRRGPPGVTVAVVSSGPRDPLVGVKVVPESSQEVVHARQSAGHGVGTTPGNVIARLTVPTNPYQSIRTAVGLSWAARRRVPGDYPDRPRSRYERTPDACARVFGVSRAVGSGGTGR